MMPWFNVDDGFHCHPKVLAAGNAAMGMWARLGSYCARYATNGIVPAEIVRAYGTRSERDRLLTVGWLTPHPDGYELHDYLDYNRTADQIAADREKAAERKRRQRDRDNRDSHAVTPTVTNGVSHKPQSNPIQSKEFTLENNSHHPHGAADDDDDRFAFVLNQLVDERVRRWPARSNQLAHRTKVTSSILTDHGDTIRQFLHERPDHDPVVCAAALWVMIQ